MNGSFKRNASGVTVAPPASENHTIKNKYLSALPGIDSCDALFRLSGDEEIFTRILHQYRDMNLNIVETLTVLIQDANFDEAVQLTHSLQGSSVNIGAKDVYKRASIIEQLCREHATEKCLPELQNLQNSLHKVLDGLSKLESSDDETLCTHKRQIDTHELKMLCDQLIQCLDDDLNEARSLLLAMKEKTAGTVYAPAIQEIEQAMHNFDTDLAKSILLKIISKPK